VHDRYDPRRDRRLARRLLAGDACLPVRADAAAVWVGPSGGRRPGCLTCLGLRRRAGSPGPIGEPRGPALRSRLLGGAVVDLALAWPALEAKLPGGSGRLVAGLAPDSARPEYACLLPVPGCPSCGSLEPGGPDPGSIAAALRTGVRARPAAADRAAALRPAVHRHVGIVRGVRSDAGEPPAARAWAPVQDLVVARRRSVEWGFGSGETAAEARTVAVLEALERYCGLPRGPVLRHASALELGAAAVDPARLVLHAGAQYRRARFPFAPFDPSTARLWTAAYSVVAGREVAVPAELVFHRMRRATPSGSPPLRPLACQTSSGCAIGWSAAEAALYALLEVLERDALLRAWYERRPPESLALDTAEDPRVPRLREQLRARGYDAFAFDVTRPGLGVPAVWVMAVNRSGDGLRTLTGACCRPDPELAVVHALQEVASALASMREHYAGHRERAQRLLVGDARVSTPADHALLYGLPEAFDRLRFLFEGARSPDRLGAHFARRCAISRLLPSRWLRAAVAAVVDSGADLLVADVTPADLRALGLTAVRALVPGALPMTFGAGRERLEGAGGLRLACPPLPHPLA